MLADAAYGLIFDMDGVIADTERINAIAAARAFKELHGLDGVKREDFEAGVGRGAEAYLRAAAQVHGLSLSDEDVEKLTAARQDLILQTLEEAPLPAFPGVLDLMSTALAAPEWSVAIATGSTREKTAAVLRSAQVPSAEMVCITASDIHARKPDPAVFLTTIDRLGLVPAACVVIEDSPSGVKAAKHAGAACVAVTNSFSKDRLGEADQIVGSLEDVSLMTLVSLLESA